MKWFKTLWTVPVVIGNYKVKIGKGDPDWKTNYFDIHALGIRNESKEPDFECLYVKKSYRRKLV